MSIVVKSGDIVDEKFEIQSLIANGGIGSVYRARQLEINRPVALKVLSLPVTQDSEELARFQREAIVLGKLRHTNIVSVYASGIWNQHPYLAMELVPGNSLEGLLAPGQPLPLSFVFAIAKQICEALQYAHDAGVVHRDLKPSNIMVVRRDDIDVAKVIDFGLVQLTGEFGDGVKTLTQTGFAVGTVLYMSPEQCAGARVDKRSDIYALGALLHHCLTGKPPFLNLGDGDSTAAYNTMKSHLELVPPAMASVCSEAKQYPAALQGLIFKSMAKKPEDRYASAAEMLQDLVHIESGKVLHVDNTFQVPASVIGLARGLKKRHWLGLLSSAVALMILGLVALGWHSEPLVATRNATSESSATHSPRYYLNMGHVYDDDKHDLAQAIRCFREAARASLESHDENSLRDALRALTPILLRAGQPAQAEIVEKQLLATVQANPYNNNYGNVLEVIAKAYSMDHNHAESLIWYQKELKYNEDNPSVDISDILTHIAFCYQGLGRTDEAVRMFNRALATARQDYGADSLTCVEPLHGLWLLEFAQHDYKRGISHARKVIAILAHSPDCEMRTFDMYSDLLDGLRDRQLYAEEAQSLAEAQQWLTSAVLQDSEKQTIEAKFITLEAGLDLDCGRYAKAQELLLAYLHDADSKHFLAPGRCYAIIFTACVREHKFEEARKWQAAALSSHFLPKQTPTGDDIAWLCHLSDAYAEVGENAARRVVLETTLAVVEKQFGQESMHCSLPLLSMSQLEFDEHHYDLAAMYSRKVIALTEHVPGEEDYTLTAYLRLAWSLEAVRLYAEEEKCMAQERRWLVRAPFSERRKLGVRTDLDSIQARIQPHEQPNDHSPENRG